MTVEARRLQEGLDDLEARSLDAVLRMKAELAATQADVRALAKALRGYSSHGACYCTRCRNTAAALSRPGVKALEAE